MDVKNRNGSVFRDDKSVHPLQDLDLTASANALSQGKTIENISLIGRFNGVKCDPGSNFLYKRMESGKKA